VEGTGDMSHSSVLILLPAAQQIEARACAATMHEHERFDGCIEVQRMGD